ncbi:MAG: T9SS type A sorting domain-containing protein [Gemmatimonadota bacterium]|nr:MAG: T9SS type A sorting domain-containing protein [Gemmatimonadota bacterium]
MGRFVIALAVVLCVLSTAVYSDTGEVKLIRVDLTKKTEAEILELMKLGPDVAFYNPDEYYVDIVARGSEDAAIEQLGFKITVLMEDLRARTKVLQAQEYFDHFHSYAEMLAEMQAVEAAHPGIAKVYDIGDSWEKTQSLADRDIWAIKISDNVAVEEPAEPEILYMGCHHAREIITPELLLYFMNYLVDNYGTDPQVTNIVDNRQVWIVPMVNPDGLEYVRNDDIWWRKNRRDNGDGTYGVDLNRNYGYQWGYDDYGSSPNTSGATYRGTAAFSEPETQAIRDLVESHNFVIALSYHSHADVYVFPWNYIEANTPDHATFICIAGGMAAFNGYEYGNPLAGIMYLVNGGTDDWMYGEQTTKNKVFGFTPEVGHAFHPDTTEVIALILENLGPNLFVAEYAGTAMECVMVQPSNITVGHRAGDYTYTVDCSNPGMNWTASVIGGGTWLSIISGSSGTGDGTIQVHCNENAGVDFRVGTVEVVSLTADNSPVEVTVTQYNDRDALIWLPPDVTSTSAVAMQAALTANGKSSLIADEISYFELGDFDYVFVCLGIAQQCLRMNSSFPEVTQLVDYLNGGGRLYMEGGETWAYDEQTALHDMFYINGLDDGPYEGDLNTILGANDFQGMDYTYSGENVYIDRISPICPAREIHKNDSPSYVCGVAHDPTGAPYRTIGTSFQFGGLDDASASVFTKNDLMSAYLDFFDNGFVGTTAGVWKALCWLQSVQNPDGSWAHEDGPGTGSVGVTALVALAFINAGVDPLDATDVVWSALNWLLTQQNPDGSFGAYKTYETSIVVWALSAALFVTEDYYEPPALVTAVNDAKNYLLSAQCYGLAADGCTYNPGHADYGGWGYPTCNWADMSNTQFALLALKVEPGPLLSDYPDRLNAAIDYVSNCQNPDGGFHYTSPGNGTEPWGGGASYASMTAAGIWALYCCGLDAADSRIIDGKNWLFAQSGYHNHNPGNIFDPNLFYYYYVMTVMKAFTMLWQSMVIDAHTWYDDFSAELLSRQDTEGWWRGVDLAPYHPEDTEKKVLATAEAILGLQTWETAFTPDSWARWELSSPADLFVYDAQGNRCWISYETGVIECGIPGAVCSGPEPMSVTIHAPKLGEYRVEVVGRETSFYTLTMVGVFEGTRVFSDTCREFIEMLETHEWSTGVFGGIIGPITLSTNFPPSPPIGDFYISAHPKEQLVVLPMAPGAKLVSTQTENTMASGPEMVEVGQTATYTVTVISLGGFSGPVSLSVCNLCCNLIAGFGPNPVLVPPAGSVNATLIVEASSTTPVGIHPFILLGMDETGMLRHTSEVRLKVIDAPDFTLTVAQDTAFVLQRGGTLVATTVTSLLGFNEAVELTVEGLPAGVTSSFYPDPVTPMPSGSINSVLTLRSSMAAPLGAHTVSVTGEAEDSLVHSDEFVLVIEESGDDPTVALSIEPPLVIQKPDSYFDVCLYSDDMSGLYVNTLYGEISFDTTVVWFDSTMVYDSTCLDSTGWDIKWHFKGGAHDTVQFWLIGGGDASEGIECGGCLVNFGFWVDASATPGDTSFITIEEIFFDEGSWETAAEEGMVIVNRPPELVTAVDETIYYHEMYEECFDIVAVDADNDSIVLWSELDPEPCDGAGEDTVRGLGSTSMEFCWRPLKLGACDTLDIDFIAMSTHTTGQPLYDTVSTTIVVEDCEILVAWPDTTWHAGGWLEIPVRIHPDYEPLADLDVVSVTLVLCYDPELMTVGEVGNEGLITENWGALTYDVDEEGGTIAVSMAGNYPLPQSDPICTWYDMLYVGFWIDPEAEEGACNYLCIDHVMFNEGEPAACHDDGVFIVVRHAIGGSVSYCSTGVAVDDVAMTLTWDVDLDGLIDEVMLNATDENGDYWFYHLYGSTGEYCVTPSKAGGLGIQTITSYDAAMILRTICNAVTLDSCQLEAADVTGDGTVSAFDASVLLKYVVTQNTNAPLIPENSIGSWLFFPPVRCTVSIKDDVPDQDFYAVLVGDVSRNWPGSAGPKIAAGGIEVEINDPGIVLTFSEPVAAMDLVLRNAADLRPASVHIDGALVEWRTDGDEIRVAAAGERDFSQVALTFPELFRAVLDIEAIVDEATMLTATAKVVPLPKAYSLAQNYPNPFNPKTKIAFELPRECDVDLAVYNVLGQKVETLIKREMTPGHHEVIWYAESAPSGVYFCILTAGDFSAVRKMVLMK